MNLKDVVTVTKSAIAQSLGESFAEQIGTLTETDSGALTSLGKEVTSTQNFQELFTNGVITAMSKLEVEQEIWNATDLTSMDIDRQDFAGFMARMYFEPSENIYNDPSFDLTNGQDYSNMEHKFYGAEFKERVFDEEYDLLGAMSYSRNELLNAFSSWESMNDFLTGKRASMINTINMKKNAWKHMLACNAILGSVGVTKTAVHLLTDYNKEMGLTEGNVLTREKALNDSGFLAYVCRRIANTKSYMLGMNNVFNNGEHTTFSTNNNTWILKDIESRIATIVKPYAFNSEQFVFGDYETVPYWQAIKSTDGTKTFDFDTISSVVPNEATKTKLGLASEFVSAKYVIALVADWKAIGMTIISEYANASQTASASFNTEFTHNLARGVLDFNYPIVAFVID